MPASAAKAYRVGWLGSGVPPSLGDHGNGDFERALIDYGYLGGRNIVIEYRYAGGNLDRLQGLAAELVRLRVDAIVTAGEAAALAAKRATGSIPIVATELRMDPVKAGIVASLSRPGGNVTGLATQNEELWQKRLSVFKQIIPRSSRAAVLWNPANPSNAACVDEIKAAAAEPALGIQIQLYATDNAEALEQAFAAIAKDRPEALITCWDSLTLSQARKIGDFALKNGLPTLAPIKEYPEAGGLMSYGISLPAHRRRAAYYVDKLLKGANPGTLPVERAAQFDLVFNLVTAKGLHVTIPPETLVLADDLIK